MEQGSESPHTEHWSQQLQTAKWIGILLSVLLHGFGLWYLFTQLPLKPESPLAGNGETTNTVLILTPSQPTSTLHNKTKTRPKKPRKTTATLPAKPRKSTAPTPPLSPAPTPASRQSVQQDFSTQLQAARQQREANTAPESGESSEPVPTANEIARANIQAQRGWMGIDKAKSGGIFEVRDKTPFRATLIFRGWNPNTSRNAMQLIPIELGNADNIEIAIINQMIVIIRQKTQEDIPWRSQRLGRVITLSARLKDTAALQQFLMQEMFYQNRPPVEQ